ncbi:MAG: CDP-alcohol phosphatidyltransferase family protein [Bacteroidales bacterium]|nr:CDP-alcohol phosphatidyltransferase family protein [Bacteroidales bacterium]
MNIKKNIPNSITAMNLLCGVFATVFALGGELKTATLLIFAGAFFDFFDGMVARLLKVSSEIGRELDSLSDLISFGLAPAAMFSTYVKYTLVGQYNYPIANMNGLGLFWVLAPFILVVFAALRLAKFNLDTRQTENFLGLTTTATGLFTASLMWMIVDNIEWFTAWLRPSIVMMAIFIFCVLLVSEVPMFSLKIKHLTWKGNELRFILLAVAIASVVIFGVGGIALTILLYIIFSLIKHIFD